MEQKGSKFTKPFLLMAMLSEIILLLNAHFFALWCLIITISWKKSKMETVDHKQLTLLKR